MIIIIIIVIIIIIIITITIIITDLLCFKQIYMLKTKSSYS